MLRQGVLYLVLIVSLSVFAQDVNTDYESFRQSILKDYQGFRKDVLENYAKYLDGIWNEYILFKGEKRDTTPKPSIVPVMDEEPGLVQPQELPSPEIEPFNKPEPSPFETAPSVPQAPSLPNFHFSFYNVTLNSVRPSKTYSLKSLDASSISSVWKSYLETTSNSVIQSLVTISSNLGLNDWFTFELVRKYVDNLLCDGNASERIIFQHFLLTNMGYDIRMARTDRQLLLLVPFKQRMYERNYLVIDGVSYYAFFDNQSDEEKGASIYTYELPQNINAGEQLDLSFHNSSLNVPHGADKEFLLSDGVLQIKGKVNSGMMEMLRHYPQMDIPYYAASILFPSLRSDILNQLRQQVKTMSKVQAAKALLHFSQYAFDYATDGDQHGYEKTYFFEENFFYPKNDCEDRSIFFAYLVRNLLGYDVHLIQYPGHECTAINFNDNTIVGDGYIYDNKVYLICDPTYIGAPVGRCMPMYLDTMPIVELWY